MSPAVTCIILGLILLIVPAINVSGLISSQMSRRMAELAVRKAYGASRSTLMVQLLRENLPWHLPAHCSVFSFRAYSYGWVRTGCLAMVLPERILM
mgnify:FL=1